MKPRNSQSAEPIGLRVESCMIFLRGCGKTALACHSRESGSPGLSLRKQGTIWKIVDSPHQVRGRLCFRRNGILRWERIFLSKLLKVSAVGSGHRLGIRKECEK